MKLCPYSGLSGYQFAKVLCYNKARGCFGGGVLFQVPVRWLCDIQEVQFQEQIDESEHLLDATPVHNNL